MPDLNYGEYWGLLKQHKFEDAELYRQSCVPDYLYKFFGLSSDEIINKIKLDTIAADSISISSIRNLNDPFEFMGISINTQDLIDHGFDGYIVQKFIELVEGYKDKFFISSFTSQMNDNMPLWAYYTNDYYGFCIKYKVTDKRKIHAISYEKERVKISVIIGNLFSEFVELYKKGGGKISETGHLYSLLLNNHMLMKHISWSHEKEYRLIYPVPEGHAGSRYTLSNSEAGLKIEKIIAGHSCHKDHKMRLTEIARSLGIGNAYGTRISDSQYMLEEEIL